MRTSASTVRDADTANQLEVPEDLVEAPQLSPTVASGSSASADTPPRTPKQCGRILVQETAPYQGTKSHTPDIGSPEYVYAKGAHKLLNRSQPGPLIPHWNYADDLPLLPPIAQSNNIVNLSEADSPRGV